MLINGEGLNNIRYAEDTVIPADTVEGLQKHISRIAEESCRFGLDFQYKKNKYIVISKNTIPPRQLLVNQQPTTQASNYCYLGTNLNDVGSLDRNKR